MDAVPTYPPEPARRDAMLRRLHRVYSHGAKFHHFLTRRIRPAGVALGAVFVLATCLGIGHERSSVYQLFSLAVAMFFLGLPWVCLRRAKLTAIRETPRYATAGVPLRYIVRVRNTGRRRIARAWLAETPPDPRPGLDDFTSTKEPGEDERNRFDRTFAYFRWQWLLLRNRLFTDGSSARELRLDPLQETRVALEITPLRRGVIVLGDLRAVLPDPFGFFQRCVTIDAAPRTMIVLPKRHPLPAFELPGGAAFRINGEANTNAIGNSGEFVGLRDYRPGDPQRQIHWKSWARTGRPIVKELEDTFCPRFGLVLDTLVDSDGDARFEDTVSVAASFASSIDTSESLLDLMFIKDQAHMVTAGRGEERAEKLLEVLAGVTPDRRGNWESLTRLVLKHRDDLTSCLLIFNGWDKERAAFLESLTRRGIVCAPIIVGSGPANPAAPGHWLEAGHIARDLRRLPRALRQHT